jgi:hypothetical protein
MGETSVRKDCMSSALEKDTAKLNAIPLVIRWSSQEALHDYQQTLNSRSTLGCCWEPSTFCVPFKEKQ